MLRMALSIVFLSSIAGCASMLNTATGRMADNITTAMLNQDDIETVRAGAPAYLLMIDGLIEGSPKDESLLLAGSKLYSSYASAFVTDEDRSKRMANKSLSYARTAMCQKNRTRWGPPRNRDPKTASAFPATIGSRSMGSSAGSYSRSAS